ncbi:hypothetical protein [Kitasatospora sp. GP82]|uniref:hypothetical protein n=1 Tax=Kitasatospora sp. GP82 TaxID=3035089 RepID=UPI00247337F9|nr:hypothetical protein [Kitasatospora sp. GP82]MDH6128880.1 hypothetical protein [Kitasatospora sp. GP82]
MGELTGRQAAFVRVALHLPGVSPAARLVEEHLSVDLDSPEASRWRPLADVLHSERPAGVEESVSRARWELRRHPGCRVATVRTAEGAVLAATAARTLHLVAIPHFAHVVGSLLHTWLASGVTIPSDLTLTAEQAGAGQLLSLSWGDPPGRAAIRSAIRSMSGPGIDR